MTHRVRVWDLPTRVFHWVLAAAVLALVATAYAGAMQWHARLGYTVFALLLFRLVWGFVGGRWSRFSSFVYAPRSVAAYLGGRAHPDHLVGHNPLGAGSVFAMLLALAAQVATGLVSDDEIGFVGPLNRFVSSGFGLDATWYHRQVGQWLVIGLVLLHVVAIVYYLRKRQNLVRPMIVGDKEVAAPAASARDDGAMRTLGLVVIAICAAIVTWVVRLGSTGTGA